MDYRIFNVCTCSFLRVHIYTRGGWAHQQQVSTFLTRKNSHRFVLCSWCRRGSSLGFLDLESDALPTEPPRHPIATKSPHHHIVFKMWMWKYNNSADDSHMYMIIIISNCLLLFLSPANHDGSSPDYLEYNTKHAHYTNVKHINIIRKLVPSVLLS